MKDIELAENHWKFIERLLTTHGEDEKIIEKIKFHYIQAFLHGFGHGMEYEYKEKK